MSLKALRRFIGSKVIQPNYAGLTGVVFHGRYEGLVTNTTNDYGVVDASGNVTKLKSVTPHATGVEFDSNGTAPTLGGTGIVFGGAGRLRHNGVSSVFNNFHFRSSIASLKWAVHGVFKVGNTDNPDAIYAIFGNNGTSSVNKGISGVYDDRSSSSLNNSIQISITRGTTQSFITLSSNTNIFTPNRFLDVWIQVDKSLDQENQIKVFINGFRFVVSNRVDSSTMVTTPTYAMEIGSAGNAVGPAIMTLKEITFQDALNTDSFRQQFITDRMFKYGLIAFPNIVDGIQMSSDWNLVNVLDENRYYLNCHLCQKPSNDNIIVSIFTDGVAHLYDANKKISLRASSDKGRTWGAKSTIFDPVGAEALQDVSAGYDSSGRLHLLCDTHTSLSVGATHKLYYMYSDNDGSSWSTPSDITSVLPSDGLLTFRTYCNIIDNNGALMLGIYKVTDEGTTTNSARYLLRSTNGGANWTAITIQALGATYRNECAIVGLSSTVVLVVTRDESTLEWYQSISTDNGLTWTNQGALDFGETITPLAGPVRLKQFLINGTAVVACYYIDRGKDLFKVIYGKVSDLISSGISGWNLASKFTIHQGSGEHLHYGDVCHYDNNFKALAMYVIDTYPIVGGTENELYTIDVPTFHYPFVKSALGL